MSPTSTSLIKYNLNNSYVVLRQVEQSDGNDNGNGDNGNGDNKEPNPPFDTDPEPGPQPDELDEGSSIFSP